MENEGKEKGEQVPLLYVELWMMTGRRNGFGGRLVGLVSVFLAVAVGGLTCALVLFGQLGLRCQDAGEGEEAGAGGDGWEAGRLAETERERGHGQRQPLQLRELVSLELLPYDGVHLWWGDLFGSLYRPQNLLLVLLRQVRQDLSTDPI